MNYGTMCNIPSLTPKIKHFFSKVYNHIEYGGILDKKKKRSRMNKSTDKGY